MNMPIDPRIFNYVIMALYIANSVMWALNKRWADASYWLCAFGITATVTWGYKH